MCNESARGLDVNQWNIGAAKSVTMDQLWTWDKVDGSDTLRKPISGADGCTYFEKELCCDLEKSMWRKHRSAFQDHVKYMHNDIVKPFRVGIL